jgi:hypothetical protein
MTGMGLIVLREEKMTVGISSRARPHLDLIKSRSFTAKKILAEMERDERTNYYFDVGARATEAMGCGIAYTVDRPMPPFFKRRFMGARAGKYSYVMEVNIGDCKVQFVDKLGNSFTPTIERLFAHEMGHGYVFLKSNPEAARILSQMDYDRAVHYENVIAREMDPGAPTRAVSDHGNFRDKFKMFN